MSVEERKRNSKQLPKPRLALVSAPVASSDRGDKRRDSNKELLPLDALVSPGFVASASPVDGVLSQGRSLKSPARHVVSGYADEMKENLRTLKASESIVIPENEFDIKLADERTSSGASNSPDNLNVGCGSQRASPRSSPVRNRDSNSPNYRHFLLPSNENSPTSIKYNSLPRRKLPLVPSQKSPIMFVGKPEQKQGTMYEQSVKQETTAAVCEPVESSKEPRDITHGEAKTKMTDLSSLEKGNVFGGDETSLSGVSVGTQKVTIKCDDLSLMEPSTQGELDMSVKSAYDSKDGMADVTLMMLPQNGVGASRENKPTGAAVPAVPVRHKGSVPAPRHSQIPGHSGNNSAFRDQDLVEGDRVSCEQSEGSRTTQCNGKPPESQEEKCERLSPSAVPVPSQDTTTLASAPKVLPEPVADGKVRVTRTPSYRNRVMAKARNRYRRRQDLCACPTADGSEIGEDGKCPNCNLSRVASRSQTSLGIMEEREKAEELSENSQSNNRRSFTPGLPPLPGNTGSPRERKGLKKVPVSSRVDVLMSSDLFKRHLAKHEQLLQRHTMNYKRFGMQKAVSNLDLSEASLYLDSDEADTSWNRLKPSDTTVTAEINDKSRTSTEQSSSEGDSSATTRRRRSRRYSLTGEKDSSSENLFEKEKNKANQSAESGTDEPVTPSSNKLRAKTIVSRPPIPSFVEFRQHRNHTVLTRSASEGGRGSHSNRTISKQFVKVSLEKMEIALDSSSTETKDKDFYVQQDLEPIEEIHIESKDSRESVVNCIESKTQGDKLEVEDDVSVSSPAETTVENESKADAVTASEFPDSDVGGPEVLTEDVKDLEKTEEQADDDVFVDNDPGAPDACEDQRDVSQLGGQSRGGNSAVKPRRKLPSLTGILDGQDYPVSSDSAQDVSVEDSYRVLSPSQKVRERRRKGSKRPRSLISKKSSLVGLIQGLEDKDLDSMKTELQSPRSDTGVTVAMRGVRTKLRRGHSMSSRNGSNSDQTPSRIFNFSPSLDLPDSFVTDDSSRDNTSRDGGSETEKVLGLDKDSVKGDNSINLERNSATSSVGPESGSVSTATSAAGSSLSISESLHSEVNDGDPISRLLSDEIDVIVDSLKSRTNTYKDDNIPVSRSTSDACDVTPEALRKRKERRERPYKSDPFSGSEIIPASKRYLLREERARLRQHKSFASSSKEEILEFLGDVRLGGNLDQHDSFPSLEELNEDDEQTQSLSDTHSERDRKIRHRYSNVSSASTDSGVIGQDGSHDSQQGSPNSTLSTNKSCPDFRLINARPLSSSCTDLTSRQMLDCLDCGSLQRADLQANLQVCPRCCRRRLERKKIIQEIQDTELNYGRDLSILKEEFYTPMKTAGLLKQDQLDSIFLNLDELIHVHGQFITKLKSAVQGANHSGDEDLHGVNMGSLFLESSTMFLTFENYCVNQSQAPVLLEQLEKEKELLRIFLHVSQNDNHLLRRMHLKSFLMVPVQRIMKYPMLLDRLYKVTPGYHGDKEAIKEAKDKIEDILGHINAKTKSAHLKLQKRKSSEKHYSVTEKMEVSRVALEILSWNRKDVCDIITSRLLLTQPADHTWASKKCKNLKFSTVHAVLLTLGEPEFDPPEDRNLVFPRSTPVRQAAVVLIREKNGKYQALREPFMLEKCVVSQDPDYKEVFEILEWNKEPYLFKADSPMETQQWVRYLRQQTNDLGFWRKRRNAMPNILLSHLAQ